MNPWRTGEMGAGVDFAVNQDIAQLTNGEVRCVGQHGDPDNPDDTSRLPCVMCGAAL